MNEAAKKRILFVDDEPLVLKGLQRTLRKRRAEWETTFASTGKERMDIQVADDHAPSRGGRGA